MATSPEEPGRQSRTTGGAVAALTVGAAAWVAASVAVMTYGTQLNWPDYVHVDFGFPMTFATHTLNTIAGPADYWDVNLNGLIVDLFFWLGGVIAIFAAGLGYFARPGRARETAFAARGPGGGQVSAMAARAEKGATPSPPSLRAQELGGE